MVNDDKNQTDKATPTDKSKEAAIELIRQKVEAAYAHEPLLEAEVQTPKTKKPVHLSKHQRYAKELMQAGLPISEIHEAWHKYYIDLPNEEKHEVWQEFYQDHGQSEHYRTYAEAGAKLQSKPYKLAKASPYRPKKLTEVAGKHLKAAAKTSAQRPKQKIHSLMVGLGAGVIAVLIVMFGLFNERFIAPFIQPSRAITNTPLISEGQAVSAEPKIIIPKINVDIPVIYGVRSIDESEVLKALEDGVVNYGDSARPGENGNVVIVGHSSNNIFNKGRYKFAFVLLNRLEIGDTFHLQKDGQRYTYQVYEKKVVKPEDVSVLGARDKPATASLITCDPPGTSINRLVVVGEQIDPNPSTNKAAPASSQVTTQTKTIPSNAPSLWSRFTNWLSR